MDGVSLDGLLVNPEVSVRNDFVLEWWNLVEFPGLTHYAALRTADSKYVSYPAAGEAELYDLVNDPDELDNRAGHPAYQSLVSAAQARLDELLSY
jgi:hypothetical protein